jgi:hypothetical protein
VTVGLVLSLPRTGIGSSLGTAGLACSVSRPSGNGDMSAGDIADTSAVPWRPFCDDSIDHGYWLLKLHLPRNPRLITALDGH